MATDIKPLNKMNADESAYYNNLLQTFKKFPMGLGNQMAIGLEQKARPQYDINPIYQQNVDLAKTNLYAPDREVEAEKTQLDESSADAMNKALMASSSSTGLLDMLSKVYSNKTKALRGIYQDQAAIKQQKLATLMGANISSAEEADKAWNYNVNEPYQLQLKSDVEREKYRQEHANDFLDFLGSIATSVLPGLNIFGGGKKSAPTPSTEDA